MARCFQQTLSNLFHKYASHLSAARFDKQAFLTAVNQSDREVSCLLSVSYYTRMTLGISASRLSVPPKCGVYSPMSERIFCQVEGSYLIPAHFSPCTLHLGHQRISRSSAAFARERFLRSTSGEEKCIASLASIRILRTRVSSPNRKENSLFI